MSFPGFLLTKKLKPFRILDNKKLSTDQDSIFLMLLKKI